MEFLITLPYVISGSICLVIGLILLFIKSPSKDLNNNLHFTRIKVLIALSAFLDVIVDVVTVVGAIEHTDIYLLDYMFVPVIYYMQLAMITYALLGLIHSPLQSRKFWIGIPSSVLILYAVYLTVYFNSSQTYKAFVETPVAEIFHMAIFVITTVSMLLCIAALFIQTRKYDEGLVNLHSGTIVYEGRKFEFINYAFICYFLLAVVDFLWHNDLANTVIILINTAIFVAFFITIMDLRDVYYNVSSIKYYNDSFHIQSPKDAVEAPSIKEKIQNWKNSPEKEWLKEGLTLTAVADKIRIKPRLLSGYINDILGMNFNKWICTLRIEEAQKMIKDDPSISISDIAFSTGFSDTSALSRTFKNITGESPSEYKKRVSAI